MRFKYLIATVALGTIVLAACGGGSNAASTTHRSAAPIMTTNATAVQSGDTSLGTVLVSASGHTIYARTTDTNGKSSCTGACAPVWPAVVVGKGWSVAPGLARTLYSTTTRDDGSRQLVAGQWPLYTFSGDSQPGDVNGQGSGGVWFAVGVDGKLIKDTPPSPVGVPASSGY